MVDEPLAQEGAHAHPRAEHGIGVLKDHLDVPVQVPEPLALELGYIPAAQNDLALGGADQPGDHARDGALAAAALTYERNALSGIDRQVRVSDGAHLPSVVRAEGLADMPKLQDRLSIIRHLFHYAILSSSSSITASSRDRV